MESERLDRRWWKIEDDVARASTICSVARDLARHEDRRSTLRSFAELYTDRPLTSALPFEFLRNRKARHNVIQNGIDAVHARIAKSQPRPWIVTQDGDWELFRRSEQMTLWVNGEIERLRVHELGPDAVLEAEICGSAAVQIYESSDTDRPAVEQVWIGDLHVDPREEANRCVRTLYKTRVVDKDVLSSEYDGKELIIDQAKGADFADEPAVDAAMAVGDAALVVEAWRLLPGGKVRHCVCVDAGMLADEEYEDDWFPFVFLHYSRPPGRFWGQGLVERMAGTQAELNMQSDMISESYRKWAPSIWLRAGSVASKIKITNEEWAVYEYQGDPPVFINPAGVAADVSMREESLIQRAYELQGISQLSAQSQKPAGLNSGRALTVHQDIEAERFSSFGRSYERFVVDLARRLIRCAERIAESGDGRAKKLTALGGEEGLRAVQFKDARMTAEVYRLRVFPISALSNTPAGRLQNVANMLELGLISDRDEALELMNMPDVDRYSHERLAARHVVDKRIEQTIDGPDVKAVHEHCDLGYAIRWGTLRLDLAEIKGAPDDVLDRLDAFVSYAVELKKRLAAEQAAQMQAQQAATQPQPSAPAGPAPIPMPQVAA